MKIQKLLFNIPMAIFYSITIYTTVTSKNQILFPHSYPKYVEPQDLVIPIPFTPEPIGGLSQGELIGYFWDSTSNNSTLIYPGKAKIDNDKYINVLAIDSKDEKAADQALQNGLVYIGTFMRKNSPIIYHLYGQYLATVVTGD